MVAHIKRLRDNEGFTLVEMLVVLIIVGIVVSISVISLAGARDSAILASCRTDYKMVQSALAAYLNDYGGASPIAAPTAEQLNLYAATGELVAKGYMSALPIQTSPPYEITLTSLASGGVAVKVDAVSSSAADACLDLGVG